MLSLAACLVGLRCLGTEFRTASGVQVFRASGRGTRVMQGYADRRPRGSAPPSPGTDAGLDAESTASAALRADSAIGSASFISARASNSSSAIPSLIAFRCLTKSLDRVAGSSRVEDGRRSRVGDSACGSSDALRCGRERVTCADQVAALCISRPRDKRDGIEAGGVDRSRGAHAALRTPRMGSKTTSVPNGRRARRREATV